MRLVRPGLSGFRRDWPFSLGIAAGMKVLYFAQCAEWMKRREEEIALEEPVRLIDLIRTSPDLSPLQGHLSALKISLNHEIVDVDVEVSDDDEVGFLPPISGG